VPIVGETSASCSTSFDYRFPKPPAKYPG